VKYGTPIASRGSVPAGSAVFFVGAQIWTGFKLAAVSVPRSFSSVTLRRIVLPFTG
jgi:hypothetical protein